MVVYTENITWQKTHFCNDDGIDSFSKKIIIFFSLVKIIVLQFYLTFCTKKIFHLQLTLWLYYAHIFNDCCLLDAACSMYFFFEAKKKRISDQKACKPKYVVDLRFETIRTVVSSEMKIYDIFWKVNWLRKVWQSSLIASST